MRHLMLFAVLAMFVPNVCFGSNGDKPIKLPKPIKDNYLHLATGPVIIPGEAAEVNDF